MRTVAGREQTHGILDDGDRVRVESGVDVRAEQHAVGRAVQVLRRHLHVLVEGVLRQPVPLRAADVTVRGICAKESSCQLTILKFVETGQMCAACMSTRYGVPVTTHCP